MVNGMVRIDSQGASASIGPGRHVTARLMVYVLLSVLLIQMFPQVLAFVAIFVLMDTIGDIFPAVGDGTRLGLLLVYLGGAMGVNTWLMKGFFDTIPFDLDESAKVDGATHVQIYFRIIMPLVVPILAVVFLLSFIFLVNDFVLARAVLGIGQENDFTLSVGLWNFVNDRFNARWGIFAADHRAVPLPAALHRVRAHRRRRQGLIRADAGRPRNRPPRLRHPREPVPIRSALRSGRCSSLLPAR